MSTSLVKEQQKKNDSIRGKKKFGTANPLGQVQDILGILKACGGTLPRLKVDTYESRPRILFIEQGDPSNILVRDEYI